LAGHVGAALAIGCAERRVNVGLFVTAALLLDLLLWSFVLIGWESVTIPSDFASSRQPSFVFAYSHGLLAAAVWSIVAGAIAFLAQRRHPNLRWRTAVLIGLAVFSHWLLDALVHRPELALAGDASAKLGLALWDRLPLALAVEAAIVAVGGWLFLRRSTLSPARSRALAVLTAAVLATTVLGMTMAPPAPSPSAMAWSSLSVVVLLGALSAWLGHRRDVAAP
jgi:uncharacterized membrane protein